MQVDIVLVSYNSARWIPGCLSALAALDYDKAQLHVYLADNASADKSADIAEDWQARHPSALPLTVLRLAGNKGFGAGCNAGAGAGSAPWLFFLNLDTEIFPDCLRRLEQAAQSADERTAALECRQLPFETGHEIDPVTMEVPWASGAALLVKRAAFEAAGRFDEHLFMYCEDVDLSWRLRAQGNTLLYVPSARVRHYSDADGTAAPKLGEYAGSYYGNLLLRYKFGTWRDIFDGEKMYLAVLRHPMHFDGVRRVMAKNYLRHFAALWPFLLWRLTHRAAYKTHTARFAGGFSADRGRQACPQTEAGPKVSVLIRTCGRPEVLRRTLAALRWQTYANWEIVVLEDGAPVSQGMLEQEFSDLPIRYFATGEKVGRGRAGNLAIEKASGEYCNFLDDDDYFYPDHLEMMAGLAGEHPEADIVLGSSMACYARKESDSPYRFCVERLEPMVFDRIDLFTMCSSCRIAIQTVLFKKELYEKWGGMREDLPGNEDWAMWLKYLGRGRRIGGSAPDVTRATSMFLVPADAAAAAQREAAYRKYRAAMYEDDSLTFTVTAAQLRDFYTDMLRDVAHLRQQGLLERYLDENLPR